MKLVITILCLLVFGIVGMIFNSYWLTPRTISYIKANGSALNRLLIALGSVAVVYGCMVLFAYFASI